MVSSQAHTCARGTRGLIVGAALAALVPAARLDAQAAGQAAGIPAGCTYMACALRAEPGFGGTRLVRGASGERISTLGGFGGGTGPLLAGGDSAAHYARRYTGAQRTAGVLGLAAAATWIYAVVRANDDDDRGFEDDAVVAGLVSVGLTIVAIPFQWRAQRSLARSVWWYNAAIPR
jgi:hypothetical protein